MKKFLTIFLLFFIQTFASICPMQIETTLQCNQKTLVTQATAAALNNKRLALNTGEKFNAKLAKVILEELSIHYKDVTFHHLIIQIKCRVNPQHKGEDFLESFCEKIRKKLEHVTNLRKKLFQFFSAHTSYLQDSVSHTHIITFKDPFEKENNVSKS